ncbi:hypothetical protein L2E82_04995 [Cichorium intybus]|uniref:Uncharacterized protein n=1 Tax=Cichorium intybus TaxID=13427 RepID=A0ACB9H7G8_CICIN|nr:hypothetical protein L2E82_04995 [Cichorium intybus]
MEDRNKLAAIKSSDGFTSSFLNASPHHRKQPLKSDYDLMGMNIFMNIITKRKRKKGFTDATCEIEGDGNPDIGVKQLGRDLTGLEKQFPEKLL